MAASLVRPLFAFADRLRNVISELGTDKDKSTQGSWVFCELNTAQLEAAYRSDWMAGKIVDIPADDSTREWRHWYTDDNTIAAIEAIEKEHNIQQKVCEAISLCRLYGGSVILLGVGDQDPTTPLDTSKIGKDALKFAHVMNRWEITANAIVRDPLDPLYGEPSSYEVNTQTKGMKIVHPSRVIRFIGTKRPSTIQAQDAWGDSILQRVADAVKDAGATMSGMASMLQEAKVDVIKVPNLTDHLSNQEYSTGLSNRFSFANTMKSLNNMLLLDKEEEWERITVDFSGLPDLARVQLLVLCGAADIPATRFLGQAPQGLNASGDSDTRNYYDKIGSDQKTKLSPTIKRLDEVIIASAVGKIDPDIYYEWDPLWQQTDKEIADTNLSLAQAWKIDVDSGLIKPEILADARANQIIESGAYPGFKQIVEDIGAGEVFDKPDPTLRPPPPPPPPVIDPKTGKPVPPDPNADPFAQLKAAQAKAKGATDAIKRIVKDMEPRPLYIRRQLLNAREVLTWAAKQGIPELEPGSELHVTVCFSRTPVDWLKAGQADTWGPMNKPDNGTLTVSPGGPRYVERWMDRKGRNIVVLQFASTMLSYRHCDILSRTEGTYDFDEYIPHVTLAIDVGDYDASNVEPYRGAIELGPEIFEDIKVDIDPDEGTTT